MQLITLGGLRFDEGSFGRIKPLLLLSYLALEGPKERRYLTELFWPEARDPRNSLTKALGRLKHVIPEQIGSDELRVWTHIETDVEHLLAKLGEHKYKQAFALYKGPFLHGANLSAWSIELEEWVYAKRESLAARMQKSLLKLAEAEASCGKFPAASRYAEDAYTLDYASDLEPEDLMRFYTLLQAGDSPLSLRIKEEARSFDIDLTLSSQEAKTRLQRTLIGREQEQARLQHLRAGEWVWLRGKAGMGKTSLLRSLEGQFLPGRSGLPFATLEPLLKHSISEGQSSIVQSLRKLEGNIIIDNWELVDEESQAALARLFELGSQASIIISSRLPSPFKLDTRLELGPISKEILSSYPGAWEKTGGLPAFVDAYLRNEPLLNILEDKVKALSQQEKEIFFALSLLDGPDTALVRRALKLNAISMAEGLENLLSRGLIEPGGTARVRQAAKDYLQTLPTLHGPLCLKLARALKPKEAFPLYQQSRHLWEEQDEPQALEAYLVWARELLERGFAQRAIHTLEEAPEGSNLNFYKGRALERAGHFQEALGEIAHLVDTPEVLALKSVLFYRLGQPENAKEAAEGALEGSMETRAIALNTLGELKRFQGNFQEATVFYRRTAALWQAQGNRTRWADALNNLAIAQAGKNEVSHSEETFSSALEAAGDNLLLRARILLNLGVLKERGGQLKDAEDIYLDALSQTELTGANTTATRAWNNLGWVYHQQEKITKAEDAYKTALGLAQQAGEKEMQCRILANLAELTEDFEAWQEALYLMRSSGHSAMAKRFTSRLTENHPFRLRSE